VAIKGTTFAISTASQAVVVDGENAPLPALTRLEPSRLSL
jgi:hypothetical protein